MALYIPHSIFHLARRLYVRPETFGPYYVHLLCAKGRRLFRKHTFFLFACKTDRYGRRRMPKPVAKYNVYNIIVLCYSDRMIDIA